MEKREEQWRKEREKWKKEKEELFERIRRLEGDKEKRENRRLNIVIKGVELTDDNLEENVEEFIDRSLNLNVKVIKTYALNKRRDEQKEKMVVANLQNWKMKKQLIRKKKELQRGVYIDDDLTEKERGIQQEIRRSAKAERGKGNNTKIGYMKLQMEGKWLKWNEWEGCLVEETDRRRKA